MNVFLDKAIAENYDSYYLTVPGKRIDQLEKAAVLKYFANIPRTAMLELGCGTGHWTEFFSKLGFDVTATDASEAMLAVAKTKKFQNVHFRKADVLDLPFSDHSFSVITAITMLEFSENIPEAFRQIRRVLSPGGWFFAGCLNVNSTLGKTKDNDDVFKHAHFFTKTELLDYLSTFGAPEMSECVHLSPDFEILDGTSLQNSTEGSFIVACVQKTK